MAEVQRRRLFDPTIVRPAIVDSFRKLDPRLQARNPVMFVVFVGAVIVTVLLARDLLSVLVESKFERVSYFFYISKETNHASFFSHAFALAKLHRSFDSIEQLVTFTFCKRIHCPGFYQSLDSSLTNKFGIDTRAEIS